MSTRNLLTVLAAVAMSAHAVAQEATPPAPAQAAPQEVTPPAPPAPEPAKADPAANVQNAQVAPPAVSRDKDTLSVDFPDEDIKTILRNVADLFELNLVVPDTLTGKTSIKLRDVTWRQIFHVVLAPVGYTYIEEGNIIKIVSNESLQQEPAATEVFILNNAKAADIKPTIDGLVDAGVGGKILIDARSNALVITERPSRMGRIRTIIEQLDKATDQVMIESKFVEVTDRDIRNIGVNWAGLDKFQIGVKAVSQTWDRSRGQTSGDMNMGTHDTSAQAGTQGNTRNDHQDNILYGTLFQPVNSVTSLPSGSVTMPATSPSITGPTGDALNPIATTTTTGLVGSSANTNSGTSLADSLSQLVSLANTGSTNRLASAVFSASDFNIIISALKTQNNAKVVSNPTIVTLNNTEASINIGQEYPIPSYTYNQERGTFEVSGFTYKPIGINLKVTPQVNSRGNIKMLLEPEVSQQADQTSFGGSGGANIPIISTRKVKTQVSLKDGYTAGIGGLIQSQRNHGGTKVPVLGDIPGLGRLFSSKSVNDTAINLLIFLTAKVVSADGASPEEVFAHSTMEALEINSPTDMSSTPKK
jgi:type II secretory pathway component GspD/PulD (secretin)